MAQTDPDRGAFETVSYLYDLLRFFVCLVFLQFFLSIDKNILTKLF